MRRRDTTGILERVVNGEKVNGGMHRQKAYRRIKAMLDGHGFVSPRLYHFVLMDGDEVVGPQDNPERFRRVLKALCRELTHQGIRYRWRAAVELDEEKGLHLHTFMLVENTVANPDSFITPNRNTTRKGIKRNGIEGKPRRTLADIADAHLISFHIAAPKAPIHKTQNGEQKNYATIGSEAKKADCQHWLSYLAKARSKPAHIRSIYFSSRDSQHGEAK